MHDKLGKLMQKSRGPFDVYLENPRLQRDSRPANESTFALLERVRDFGAEVGRAKSLRRLNFDFCTARLLNIALRKSRDHLAGPGWQTSRKNLERSRYVRLSTVRLLHFW